MSTSKRLRYEVLRRDNHTCRYCGRSAPEVALQVDHVVPVTLGGTDDPSNLVTACRECNAGKSSTQPDDPLVDDVSQDALRWSYAMAHAADLQRRERADLAEFVEDIRETWETVFVGYLSHYHEPEGGWFWKRDPERKYEWVIYDTSQVPPKVQYLVDSEEEALEWIEERRSQHVPPLPDDWAASAHLWKAAHIDAWDLEDAAEIAKRATHVNWRARYRYFCGIIWNKVEERQSIARGLVEQDGEG